MNDLLSIDTETGGAGERQCVTHALLSLACVVTKPLASGNGDAEYCFHRLILPEPGLLIDAAAVAVNGYDPDKWVRLAAVTEQAALVDLLDWLMRVSDETAVDMWRPLAHNAAHDRGFLESALARQQLHDMWLTMVCRGWRCSCATLRAAMDAGIVARGGCSLDSLSELAGLEPRTFGDPHEALEDALRCLRGYRWLIGRMRSLTGRDAGDE